MAATNDPVRAIIAPRTEPAKYYPAPWRVAETRDGQVTVVCADGHYACMAASASSAQAIVAAVNALAGVPSSCR